MKNIALVVGVSALVVSCGTAPVRPGDAAAVTPTAFATPADGTTPVTVTRDSGYVGSGCSIEVLVEGERVARLWSRETVTLHLPAGDTIIGVKPLGACALGQSARGLREIETNIRAGRPLFFRVGYDINGLVSFNRTGLR